MSRDIGIDLGTANVLVHLKGRGIVLNQPSVVAVNVNNREVIAVGEEAYEMLGRTSKQIQVIHPLKGGVIADYELAEAMLVLFLEQMYSSSWFARPNILISTPSQISEIEVRTLIETAQKATRGKVYVSEEPLVAAIGAGLDIKQDKGAMVIDIGGGTTDIAIISKGEILLSKSMRLAGDDFDEAIIQYLKDHKQLLVGPRTAEEVKLAIASAMPDADASVYPVRGRDILTGLPKSINLSPRELYPALQQDFAAIALAAQEILEECPPEISADIMADGIMITGGGACIHHLDLFLSDYLKVSVIRADRPLSCVAIGTGLMLDLIQLGYFQEEQPSWSMRFKSWLKKVKRRLIG